MGVVQWCIWCSAEVRCAKNGICEFQRGPVAGLRTRKFCGFNPVHAKRRTPAKFRAMTPALLPAPEGPDHGTQRRPTADRAARALEALANEPDSPYLIEDGCLSIG